MIARSKKIIAKASLNVQVDLICADIQDVKIENAKMVVLNFTLQFINKNKRAEILKKIYEGLVDGGVLILSEKISFSEKSGKEFNESLYIEFKKANGYSNLEISQKRTALEKVLVPDTIEEHLERLKVCGYRRSEIWFRCLNFASMVAFK
jgi:tRNA (cmo5U34)-methyltransferase